IYVCAHTLWLPGILRATVCISCAARLAGTSKGAAAIAIPTTAADKNRRSSSCDDGSDYVRCFRRTEEIHRKLLHEIRRQEVSYAVQPEGSRAGFDQGA